ncbi:Potassium voltage-gated channel subfamily H member 6 (Ether-a-go-go-related gene potassium channel) (ERG) (Eag-related protein) (Ether-a-go-go-related protein) (Voltage-gated potassium channel subunit Kv11.2) [Durusdinium trenchii]|uniref:Ion transport domain-containing protein n=1 Tax=Durusdinium trenchii TaxID=1381693 RepID=A0ABP0NZV3_9DINO
MDTYAEPTPPRHRAQTEMQKEVNDTVSSCIDEMKVELLQKLHRIMDPVRVRRRASRISISEKLQGREISKGLAEMKEQGSLNLLLLPGPRASPACKMRSQVSPDNDTSEMVALEEFQRQGSSGVEGIESITVAEVISPTGMPTVQEAILEHHAHEHRKLRLHKAWKLEESPRLRTSNSHSNSNSFIKNASSLSLGEAAVRRAGSLRSKEETYRWYDRLTMSHRSHFCMVWDIWTSIAIAYDMVMTPMDAFTIELTPVVRALERTSSITWFVDMILSFVRSYGKLNGTEERHLKATAMSYLRTWFTFDFILVCLDMFILIAEDSSWMRYVSFLRAVRLFRLLRVLRVAKVKARIAVLAQLLHILQTQRITDRGFLMLNIAKSLMVITVINHFTEASQACLWYAIAVFMEEDDNNWVDHHSAQPGRPDSLVYIYTTAYHWSITQLTPASCEIYPRSSRERIFNIAVILFGLCIFSSFISSMAQQLAALQQLSRADRQRMHELRRFISEHHMSVALATTIVDFVRQKRGPMAQRPLKISDIEIFTGFPTVLLQKIRLEAYYFVLSKHHFYYFVYQNDRDTFSKICNNCIFEQTLDKGHEVFNSGEEGTGMYFVCHGKLSYTLFVDDESFDPTSSEDWVTLNNLLEGSCSFITSGVISEVAMWLFWFHRGRLAGDGIVSDLLFVSVDPFREVIKTTPLIQDVRLYARLYALRALRAGKEGHMLDDLWHEEEMIEEISRLSLQGGLEQAVNNLATSRVTPQKIFRAWRQQAQSGRFKRSPWRRISEWIRCCFFAPRKQELD